MKMKIVALSDLHGYLPEITESADICLLAGDIIPLEHQFHKPNSKIWFETTFAEWIKKLPVERVFMVPGNHDAYLESASRSNLLAISQACKKLTILINETSHYYDKNAQLWSIFGTPYCHIYGNWPFMRSGEYMIEKFKQIPDKCDIIISHDPPFGLNDCDVILEAPQHRSQRMFQHLGNEWLTDRLKDVDYKLLVCGHIHGGNHTHNDSKPIEVNVSILDEFYQPFYNPFYIDMEK